MTKSTTAKRANVSSGGTYESIFGYSRAVRAGSDVHVSGTCAPAGHEKSDAYTQARAALAIIENALGEAGPIVIQTQADRTMPSSISFHCASVMLPAHFSAQYFQTSLPEPNG